MRRLLCIGLLLLADNAPLAQVSEPALREHDRIRLAEVYHLADAVQNLIWPGWSEVPFVILLVTPQNEFLLRHPSPPEEFVSLGRDTLIGAEVFARPNSAQYGVNLLATFPAVGGVNTVVIGAPEDTDKNSTTWAIVALHEHFHQLQYTRPWYHAQVAALDLAGGDASGMWQLDYPFPYEDRDVARAFLDYKVALEDALAADGKDARRLAELVAARSALQQMISAADYRYLSFQLWQEGIARYTEYAVARAAAEGYEPLPAFQSLADYVPYAAAAESLAATYEQEMREVDLVSWRRVVFYPVGATEGMLLDRLNPGWKSRYFDEPFFLERYYPSD